MDFKHIIKITKVLSKPILKFCYLPDMMYEGEVIHARNNQEKWLSLSDLLTKPESVFSTRQLTGHWSQVTCDGPNLFTGTSMETPGFSGGDRVVGIVM